MRMWRGLLAATIAVLGLCAASVACAAELTAGRDFRVINPALATDANRIEVTGFFWYGCPHCFDFEPLLAEWAKKLPPDVSFRRLPTIFANNQWTPGARLYYTLEAMNLLEKLHGEAFHAIHVDRQRLDNEKIMFAWAVKKGVDAKKFSETWSSFGVLTRVRQARETTLAAGLTGVPAVMVQGKYLALATGNYGDLLATVDRLIARARAEAGGK